MTRDEVDAAVFAKLYLSSEPNLLELCYETCIGMAMRGWEIQGWQPPATEGLPCLAVVFVRPPLGDGWTRRMDVLFGREWRGAHGGMTLIAKINGLDMVNGKRLVAIPESGDYAVHVHQYDPRLTATVLNTLSDEEVIEQYSAEARGDAAISAVRSSAADVMRDMQD